MTKTAAREYCLQLIREEKLVFKEQIKIPLFKEFAKGWWDYETCPYLQSRKGRRPISRNYATQGEIAVRNHLVPAFGEKRLDQISEYDIDTWLTNFTSRVYRKNNGKGEERHYKQNSANTVFKILRTMLNYAVKQKFIKANPCNDLNLLNVVDEKIIEILTVDEVRKLFPPDWETVWDDRIFYVLNKLAACTGMRLGELLGLRGEFVHDTYVDVCKQFGRHGYGDVKTYKAHNIPIPSVVRQDWQTLIQLNGDGYLFSKNKGVKPVHRIALYKAFYAALHRIGITEEERKRRNLSIHGWRHFLNTMLLMTNIPAHKVRKVTGHVSERIQKKYDHSKAVEMTDVIAAQEKLIVGEMKQIPVEPGKALPETVETEKQAEVLVFC
jgi:integrase